MNLVEILQWFLDKRNQLAIINLGLIGPLGAGKTHFVRELLKTLEPGLENQVSSPSFTLCNHYQGKQIAVQHFDLYRLEEPEDLDQIEFYESLEEPVFTIVEWADQFPQVVRDLNCLVEIRILPDQERDYQITKLDEFVKVK